MRKIFICTSGQYSDYSIEAVFSERVLAEKFKELYDCDIEEWGLNPLKKELAKGVSAYSVYLWLDNGDSDETPDTKTFYIPYATEKRQEHFAYRGETRIIFRTYVFAKDVPHALKIANERRIQYKQLHNL